MASLCSDLRHARSLFWRCRPCLCLWCYIPCAACVRAKAHSFLLDNWPKKEKKLSKFCVCEKEIWLLDYDGYVDDDDDDHRSHTDTDHPKLILGKK